MTTLVEGYAAVVCDLDGVVYRGGQAVPHAVESLNALECPVVYATNNASRSPTSVAERLRHLGVEVVDDQVLTSSMAGARALRDLVDPGARVLAVGGEGVRWALEDAGLTIVRPGEDDAVDGVLQGYGKDVTAEDLAHAAYAIEAGATWVATNDDATLPTEHGVAPGNGALVAAVATATGTSPKVVGKPFAPLYLLGAERLGVEASRTLAIGDRLETDIGGAEAAGMDSVLVLTGIHGVRDVARSRVRPTYVIGDLRELDAAYPEVTGDGEWWRCRGTSVRISAGRWQRREASASSSPGHEADGWSLDACRAALAALAAEPELTPTERDALTAELPARQ